MNANKKRKIIDNVVNQADEHNRLWLRKYLQSNIDNIIQCVLAGNPLEHGFRGLEVQDEMARLGFNSPPVKRGSIPVA
jgi:hypothetical protein